jgi:hypothetical protein
MKAMKAGVTKIDCLLGLSVVTELVRRLFLHLAGF